MKQGVKVNREDIVVRDLKDPERDIEVSQADESTPDLCDIDDISGQENIVSPKMNAFTDTNISSEDEKEDEQDNGFFEDEIDEEI